MLIKKAYKLELVDLEVLLFYALVTYPSDKTIKQILKDADSERAEQLYDLSCELQCQLEEEMDLDEL